MSHHPKAELSDVVIDSENFAQNGGQMAGEVAVSRLARLADLLTDTGGSLRVELRGETDGEGNPGLWLKIDGSLELRCQRCLESMAAAVEVDSHLRLANAAEERTEGDAVELDATAPDTIPADREFSVLQLVEDEVLLSLPFAPRHERCLTPDGGVKDRAPSPFAVLAQLKKH